MHKIEFIEAEHKYIVDGVERPSVTTIIHDCIPSNSKWMKQCHSDRGTAVHLACQYLEEGTLDWNSLDPSILPYVRGWERFLVETGAKSLFMEHLVYNTKLYYAGTLDRVMDIGGKTGVLDIKTGAFLTADIQTAGYDLALPTPYKNRWVVKLEQNGSYKLIPYTREADYQDWEGIVRTYYYKKRRNIYGTGN